MAETRGKHTPQEFLELMKECFKGGDLEGNHGEADDLMCDLLESLGYGEGVEVFRNEERWYA